jgi:ribonuclease HI
MYIAAATDVKGCQVYVDDAVLKGFGPTAEDALNEASTLCLKVEGRLNAIRLRIDHRDKLEAIVFSKKAFSTATIRVAHPDGLETIVPVGQVWRYLGFYFTTKLCWKEHVKRCKLKAIAATRALRILVNCMKSLTLAHAQTAYLMGIRPVITYGAPVWFTGQCQEGLIKELETAQNEGVRWCLGAFQTSNVEAMHHIASIPPIRYVLGQLQDNCSMRLRAVRPNHGLVTRLAERHRLRCRKATTLANLEAMSADVTEQIDPAHEATGDVPAGLCRPLLDKIDTRVAIHSHNTDAHALVVYTDGSLIKDKSGLERGVGAGAWVTHLGKAVQELSWPCGRKAKVYDAEMIRLAKGMVAAGRLGQSLPGQITRVLLVLDNKAAVQTIEKLGAHSQQSSSITFRAALTSLITGGGTKVQVGWIKGHSGCGGNNEADQLAKLAAAAALAAEDAGGATITFACAWAKACVFKNWQKDWIECAALYGLALVTVAGRLPQRQLDKKIVHLFRAKRRWGARAIQVMLGHGWFGEYYSQFSIDKDPTCLCAGWAPKHGTGGPPVIQTRKHLLFECSRFAEARKRHIDCWFYGGSVLLGNLFGDWDGRERLLRFLTETNAFFKTTPHCLPEHPDTGNPPGTG